MKSRWHLVLLVVVILAAGCTSVITGDVRPAAGLKPRLITGETIKGVLLDDAALSKLLDQSFTAKPQLPPRFGGPEKLRQAFGTVSPVECVSVTLMTEKNAYQSGAVGNEVRNVAREMWWNLRGPTKVISVAEGVVALSTAAAATSLFEEFVQQWKRCDGTTVTIERPSIIVDRPATTISDKISEVRVANSVLAATLSVDSQLAGSPPSGPRPVARAVGVRGNCLVEVDVSFFSTRSPTDRGSGNIDTSAIDIAHAMMDRVSALS
jgi:hypothetical protein